MAQILNEQLGIVSDKTLLVRALTIPVPPAIRADQCHSAEVRASSGIENDDPSSLLPGAQIRKRARRFID